MNRTKNSRKGMGSDIIGIAILFVIIILALAFYIGIKVFEKPSAPQKEYISSKFAYDVIDVVLRTNSADCKGLSFKDIIQDCASKISSGGSNCDDGKPKTCTYAEDNLFNILKTHLKEKEGMSYYFSISTNQDDFEGNLLTWNDLSGTSKSFNFNSTEKDIPAQCPASKRSKTYQIPNIAGENIYLKLDVCV